MNLSNKGFTKNICKIFLKNLKFVQSLFKKTFYEEYMIITDAQN